MIPFLLAILTAAAAPLPKLYTTVYARTHDVTEEPHGHLRTYRYRNCVLDLDDRIGAGRDAAARFFMARYEALLPGFCKKRQPPQATLALIDGVATNWWYAFPGDEDVVVPAAQGVADALEQILGRDVVIFVTTPPIGGTVLQLDVVYGNHIKD